MVETIAEFKRDERGRERVYTFVAVAAKNKVSERSREGRNRGRKGVTKIEVSDGRGKFCN